MRDCINDNRRIRRTLTVNVRFLLSFRFANMPISSYDTHC